MEITSDMFFNCDECAKQFRFISSLQRHIKLKHSKIVEIFICDVCHETFNLKTLLSRHIRNKHQNTPLDSLHDQTSCNSNPETIFSRSVNGYNKNFEFVCNVCNSVFKQKYGLMRHITLLHQGNKTVCKGKFSCVICDNVSSNTFNALSIHYFNQHDIKMNKEAMTFSSMHNFLQWKEEEEKRSCNKFVKRCGSHHFESGVKVTIYYCHRSGVYKTRGKGLRRLKSQGSKKIGRKCPSRIHAKLTANGNVVVNYIVTHIGHDPDLCHLNLTPAEKANLATKISMRIPFEEILDEVRDSIQDTHLQRYDLVTRRDLHNIKKNLLAFRNVKHQDDPTTIDSWANETSSVLFYKRKGILNEKFPNIYVDDFCIIIMNEYQKTVLERYKHDCICVDTIRSVKNFELTTLLVLDDLRQCFPCCFMISNKTDEQFMSIFFANIKNQVGTIALKNFISDNAESVYNAWKKIMGPPTFRFYCSWNVDDAWRKNIKTKLKCNVEEQKEIYKKLRICMEGTDVKTFTLTFKNLIEQLKSNPDSEQFGVYLENDYESNVTSWANCYQFNCGLNTDMHLEQMNRTLKYTYIRGKPNKTIDTCIFEIMNFVRNEVFDPLITINKVGKLTARIKEILNSHKTSLAIPDNDIALSNEEWTIKSSKGIDRYKVTVNEQNCTCKLRCLECNICVHTYRCSCIDSLIKWNICKHIHAVQRIARISVISQNVTEISESKHNLVPNEHQIIILTPQLIPDSQNQEQFLKKKQEFIDEIVKSLNEHVNNESDLNHAQNIIKPQLVTLSAITNKNQTGMLTDDSGPSNKKVCLQRPYKIKNYAIPSSSLRELTDEERKNIAVDLLNFKNLGLKWATLDVWNGNDIKGILCLIFQLLFS